MNVNASGSSTSFPVELANKGITMPWVESLAAHLGFTVEIMFHHEVRGMLVGYWEGLDPTVREAITVLGSHRLGDSTVPAPDSSTAGTEDSESRYESDIAALKSVLPPSLFGSTGSHPVLALLTFGQLAEQALIRYDMGPAEGSPLDPEYNIAEDRTRMSLVALCRQTRGVLHEHFRVSSKDDDWKRLPFWQMASILGLDLNSNAAKFIENLRALEDVDVKRRHRTNHVLLLTLGNLVGHDTDEAFKAGVQKIRTDRKAARDSVSIENLLPESLYNCAGEDRVRDVIVILGILIEEQLTRLAQIDRDKRNSDWTTANGDLIGLVSQLRKCLRYHYSVRDYGEGDQRSRAPRLNFRQILDQLGIEGTLVSSSGANMSLDQFTARVTDAVESVVEEYEPLTDDLTETSSIMYDSLVTLETLLNSDSLEGAFSELFEGDDDEDNDEDQ